MASEPCKELVVVCEHLRILHGLLLLQFGCNLCLFVLSRLSEVFKSDNLDATWSRWSINVAGARLVLGLIHACNEDLRGLWSDSGVNDDL